MGLLSLAPVPALGSQPPSAERSDGFATDRHLSDLVVRTWAVDEGLPSVGLNRVVRSDDGHLWISSFDGLIRFDGLSFEVFDKSSITDLGPEGAEPLHLASNGFRALANAVGGGLWVGTHGHGVLLYREGRFEPIVAGDTRDWTVQVIYPDGPDRIWVGASDRGARLLHHGADGRWHSVSLIEDETVRDIVRVGSWVWLATEGGGLVGRRMVTAEASAAPYAFDPEVRVGVGDGLPSNAVTSLAASPEGDLWIGMLGGLTRMSLDSEGGAILDDLASRTCLEGKQVEALLPSEDGDLWIGAGQGLYRASAASGGLERLGGEGRGGIGSIRSLTYDQEGSLWLASTTAGLVRLRESPFRNVGPLQGLATDRVGAVLPLPSGDWLIGGDHGQLYRMTIGNDSGEHREPEVRRFEPEPPLPDERIRDLLLARDGSVWVATYSGLSRLEPDGRRGQLTTADGLPSNQVRVVYEGRDGEIWGGTRNGGLFRLHETADGVRTVEVIDRGDGLVSNFVFSIDGGNEGDLWVGARGGLHRLAQDGELRLFANGGELPGTLVFAVSVDAEGVWACTDGGLVRIENDWVVSVLGVADGLPGVSFFDMVEDPSGRYWLSSTAGVLSMSASAARARARDGNTELDLRSYDDRDGMISRQVTDTSRIGIGADGRLVFPTLGGAAIFEPSRARTDLPAPSISVSGLVVDGERHEFGAGKPVVGAPKVAAGSQRLEIELAAISFVKPEDLQVRYQLDGFDRDWVEAGRERLALYTNLDPGSYRFRAEAISASGSRSPMARLDFLVEPFWHQRPGVRVGGVAILLFLGYGLFRWRMTAVEERNRRLEEIVAMQHRAERASREAADRERAISARLREVDRVKDEFLANTSHELRTPLFGMIGLAESLIEDPGRELPEDVSADLAMIVSSGHRLGRLVDDILDSAKLDRGRLELIRGPVELHSLSDVVLTLAKPLAEQKALDLINNVDPNLPRAWADEFRLQQVIHNLLGNAIKFSADGRIEISARLTGSELLVAVSDHGIGIAEEHLEGIFDTFEQIDSAIDRAHGGTGLGLAIARQLVELHEGRIWAESELGSGTTFFFTLPIFDQQKPDEAEIGSGAYPLVGLGPASRAERARSSPGVLLRNGGEASDVTGSAPTDSPSSQSGLAAANLLRERSLARQSGKGAFTILIVDDEAVVRKVLFNHLAPHGYRLLRAKDGPECLGVLAREDIDLVVLDLMMPRMSGYEVCRTIRQVSSREDLPIILMSAKNQERDRVAGFAEGANDYLTKPITKGELLARVRVHLELLVSHRREKDRGKMLRGLLPICSNCKKIRDDQGYWKGLEEYISRHSDAEITHSICPTCAHDLFPDFPDKPMSPAPPRD